MSDPFSASLDLRPQPSRLLKAFVVTSHALILAVVCYLTWRTAWAALLFPPVCFSLLMYWSAAGLSARNAVIHVVSHADGDNDWWTRAGRHFCGETEPGSIVLPWLVILHLRSRDGHRFAVPLLPDSLPADALRRLRVRLRVARRVDSGKSG